MFVHSFVFLYFCVRCVGITKLRESDVLSHKLGGPTHRFSSSGNHQATRLADPLCDNYNFRLCLPLCLSLSYVLLDAVGGWTLLLKPTLQNLQWL